MFLFWNGFQLAVPYAEPVLGTTWVGDAETNPDSGHLPSGWNTTSMFVCEAAVRNATSTDIDQIYEF